MLLCMTGQGIAVAYGRFDVEGWCSQPGYLCTWNLARSGLKPDKPDVKVETDSCLQCCCYHANQPVRRTLHSQLLFMLLPTCGGVRMSNAAECRVSSVCCKMLQ